ncbi:hypothetical protein DEI92_12960 [Curtobacterium sp. MCBD17_034]|uniref:hypothetical protein n=1 Tax=unclassified Curtobacterium TaxID=257496 RepID=UPI000DA98381|nr:MULTISPECIES: hypothetical protein [unclassified Curtobacterium]PZF57615.1 hypothetical protein DEI92_12960 [Curtobacterium sp. MCBD17_034]PZM33707.1 hypothetical protein DEI90_12145 [Curtobacterium sp. MCBD17_031]WIB66192.1 hypothetical protein DEI93_09300 [Curtobacterium sp. MCBD17_035]
MTSRTLVRAITTVAIAAASVLAVSGCTGGHASSAGRSGTTSSSTPPAPIGTRVDVPCAALVPEQVLATYGRTFTLDTDATPAHGSTAAGIAAERGDVCTWRDASGGARLTLAVASLPESTLTKLKDTLYEDSNSVPTYTVEGYFEARKGIGRADAFTDPYWIHVESTVFGEPGDAQPVVDAVRTALSSATASASATPQAG